MWWRFLIRMSVLVLVLSAISIVLVIAITRQTSPIQGRLAYADFESSSFRINQLMGHERDVLIDSSLEFNLNDAVNLGLEWSPDGSRLAFLNIASPAGTFNQLQLYDVQTNTLETLTEFSHDAPSPSWSWSADSQRLAYTDGSSVITIITPGVADTETLQFNLRDYDLPIPLVYSLLWSPTDPNLLAVWGVNPIRRSYVVLLDISSGVSRNLMTGTVVLGDLSWSRDGQHLLYHLPPMLNFSMNTGPSYRLLNIDTRRRRELSGSDPSTQQAAWSPNGRLIALAGPANAFIRLVDPVVGRTTQQLPIPTDSSPNDLIWSSDSRLLIFTTIKRRTCDLYAIDLRTRYTLLLASSLFEACVTAPAWSSS